MVKLNHKSMNNRIQSERNLTLQSNYRSWPELKIGNILVKEVKYIGTDE